MWTVSGVHICNTNKHVEILVKCAKIRLASCGQLYTIFGQSIILKKYTASCVYETLCHDYGISRLLLCLVCYKSYLIICCPLAIMLFLYDMWCKAFSSRGISLSYRQTTHCLEKYPYKDCSGDLAANTFSAQQLGQRESTWIKGQPLSHLFFCYTLTV